MYSYDRSKVASFQDRFKGSFECVVWINDFTIEKNKSITISGTLSLYLTGDESGDIKFSDATLKKKGKKWSVANDVPPVVKALLTVLLAQESKTSKELDRLLTTYP